MGDNQIGRRVYGYIYVSFFPPTEKTNFTRFYIGQKKLAKKNNYSFDPHYHGSGRAVQDYIKANPSAKILSFCLVYAYSQEELNALENYWVSFKLKSGEYPESLNLRPGGNQAGASKESRYLMSLKHKGIPNTEEQKAKISQALKGRPKSIEHRVRAGLARRGIKTSEEAKAKMRESRKRYLMRPGVKDRMRLINPKRKEIICLETSKIFASSCEAARFCATTSDGAILMCCKNAKGRKTAGGYHWMFLDEYLISNRQSTRQALLDFT